MELPKDPRKNSLKRFATLFWRRIFPEAGGNDESLAEKCVRLLRDFWIVIFLIGIMTLLLGFMAYDAYHPDVFTPKPDRDMAVSDAYAAGWNDGREVKDKSKIKLQKEADGSFTVEIPPQAAIAPDMHVPDIYRSGTAAMWDTIWGVLTWLIGFIVFTVAINMLARLMIGAGAPGAPRLAIARLFNRAVDQAKTGATAPAANGQIGDEKDFITIIKPEDNRMRLADFIADQHVMDELVPFVDAVQAQKLEYERLVAEAEAKEEKEKKERRRAHDYTKPVVKIPPIPRGRYGHMQGTKYLIAGPPGVGKSLFALVAAGEAQVTLISVAGTFEKMFIGAGANRVQILEQVARDNAPCIVFIDEGDEAGKQRGKNVGVGANSDASTTALLRALDGVETKVGHANGVHWVVATNYVDKIDEALKRSGRLRLVNFSLPSLETMRRLLKHYFNKLAVPLGDDLDPSSAAVASMILGKTGADVAELANLFAGLAEEVEKEERRRLQTCLTLEANRLAEAGVSSEGIEDALKMGGLSAEKIEERLASLRFGQEHFIESVLRLMMGRKKKVSQDESFKTVFDIAAHEGMHGLASAVMEWLGLLDHRVRLLTVADREKSLGLMYSSPDHEEKQVSIKNVLGRIVTAFAGAMGQLVVRPDGKRWGDEVDLHRDSGASADNKQAAELIHQSIALFGGSLRLGPISKGQGGHTWFTEMGPELVDNIDREVLLRQKLGQFLSWRIATILMRNEVVWDLFDEVLNSRSRIVLEDRFYQYFGKIISDPSVRRQIMALPAQYNKLARDERKALAWTPARQAWLARRFIERKTAWLNGKYDEARCRRNGIESLPVSAGSAPAREEQVSSGS